MFRDFNPRSRIWICLPQIERVDKRFIDTRLTGWLKIHWGAKINLVSRTNERVKYSFFFDTRVYRIIHAIRVGSWMAAIWISEARMNSYAARVFSLSYAEWAKNYLRSRIWNTLNDRCIFFLFTYWFAINK